MKVRIFDATVIVVAIVALAVFIVTYNIAGTVKAFTHIQIKYFLFALGAWVLFTISKFLPWLRIIKKVKVKVPILKSILMMYGFFGLGFMPVGVGQLLPLRELDKFRKNARFFSLGIITSLSSTASLGAMLLALITAIIISQFVVYILALFVGTYVVLSFLGLDWPYRKLDDFLKNVKFFKNWDFIKHAQRYLKGMRRERNLMSQREILLGTALFIPSLILESTLLMLVAMAFSQNLSLVAAIFIFTVSVVLGNFSMAPAGVGVMDVSMAALLLAFGLPGVVTISTILIFRLLNTVLVIFAGYVSMGVLRAVNRKIKAL